ncbi:FGGY-family carbohydrate kinase, partial [Escherichia coli]|uniref:FGGY-family carbohydrate kinase n=1 Tax=Escherichia coli TaxID=562 RepID=UPI00116D8BFD
VMLSAASALRWVTQLLGQPDEATLIAQVAALTPAQREQAPLFLPYLSGERTPHNDARAQGVFFGLTHAHDAAALGYAVLEGVVVRC